MIQDHYFPASVEQIAKRLEGEKKELEPESAKRKELINKRREGWKSKDQKYLMN